MEAAELVKAFMRGAAQQVYVVTARSPGGSYAAFTASAVTSISLSPPLIMVAVDKGSRSHEAMVSARHFIVMLLAKEDEWLARLMTQSSDPLDKLRQSGFMEDKYGPYVPLPRPRLVARRWAIYDGGDHSIVIGEVIDGEALDVKCPLLYHNRSYTSLYGC